MPQHSLLTYVYLPQYFNNLLMIGNMYFGITLSNH